MEMRQKLESDEDYPEGDFAKFVLKEGQVHSFRLSDKPKDKQEWKLLDALIANLKEKWGVPRK